MILKPHPQVLHALAREDETFLALKELLIPFGITRFYTDGWGAYRRHLDPTMHTVGKRHTQKIERKHTTLRARIKRLVRKTICFRALCLCMI
jgi:insertion element IS1 protein InsB